MAEVINVANEIRGASSSDIDIVIGAGFNVDLQGELIVTVIATGFDSNPEQEALIKGTKLPETPATPNFVPKGSMEETDEINKTKIKKKPGEPIPWLGSKFK